MLGICIEMKVLNIHSRKVNSPKHKLLELLDTLSTKEDKIWPIEKWPAMNFKKGLTIGAYGGHGPIRYELIEYSPQSHLTFKFKKPKGFKGIHKLEFIESNPEQTEIKHTIDMTTSGVGTLKWLTAIKWLHNALIEDAFDKIENQLSGKSIRTKWNSWVKILRAVLLPQK